MIRSLIRRFSEVCMNAHDILYLITARKSKAKRIWNSFKLSKYQRCFPFYKRSVYLSVVPKIIIKQPKAKSGFKRGQRRQRKIT